MMLHLQINSSFLHLAVNDWEGNDAYLSSSENITAINVVNDAAKRGCQTGDLICSCSMIRQSSKAPAPNIV